MNTTSRGGSTMHKYRLLSIPVPRLVTRSPWPWIPVTHTYGRGPVTHTYGREPVTHTYGRGPVTHTYGKEPVTHTYGQGPVMHRCHSIPGLRPVRYFRYLPELAGPDEMSGAPHSADREIGGAWMSPVSEGDGGAVEQGA